ncbi:MAG: hypothetical protein RR540_07140 [Oscillospiraceae bacterium]
MAYTQSDVNSMRQDAIRRVQEMQRRSEGYINENPKPPQEPQQAPKPQQNPSQNFEQPHNNPQQNPFAALFSNNFQQPKSKNVEKPVENVEQSPSKGLFGGFLDGILPDLHLDEEKIIIIILIIILAREGADLKLLLALGYLLM